MSQSNLKELIGRFADGDGYGDPESRRNNEIKLHFLLAQEQSRTATRLNWLTFCLVVVGLLNVAVLAIQVWGR